MHWLFKCLLTVFMFTLVHGIYWKNLRSIHLVKRATADGGLVFPGSPVQPCSQANTSCIAMDKCRTAFTGDRKKLPAICQWDGNNPLVCCPSEVTRAKTKAPPTEFPEADCARQNMIQMIGGLSLVKRAIHTAVVGGTDVRSINSYPFMAAIFLTTEVGREFLCGGTLLSKTVILTAAHCFLSKESTSKYLVRLGSRNFQSAGDESHLKEFEVTRVKVHPGFKYPQLYNDIALLRIKGLASYSDGTKPVCLIERAEDRKSKSPLTILGWGSKQSGGSASDILQEAVIDAISNSKCNSTLQKLGVLSTNFPKGINNRVLCAGNTNNTSRDACQGDSGGPAVVLVDGIWKQRGIVSGGIGCGVPGNPGLYTRVSEYTTWIKQNA